jgi:hypothetical protein
MSHIESPVAHEKDLNGPSNEPPSAAPSRSIDDPVHSLIAGRGKGRAEDRARWPSTVPS